MARPHLSVCVALSYVLAFSSPLVTARLGGRSCQPSFFFPDLHINDNNDLRLLTEIDGNEHGASADFKIVAVAASSRHGWTESRRSPFSLIQVRQLNLHRMSLLNPGFPHALDLSGAWREILPMEKLSVGEQPTRDEFLASWSFSASNLHEHMAWIKVGLSLRQDFPDRAEQEPFHLDEDEWKPIVNELWRVAFGLLFGATIGMVFTASVAVIWSLARHTCARSQDDEDNVGFLYGYQELPSSEEKDSSKGEDDKEGAMAVQTM